MTLVTNPQSTLATLIPFDTPKAYKSGTFRFPKGKSPRGQMVGIVAEGLYYGARRFIRSRYGKGIVGTSIAGTLITNLADDSPGNGSFSTQYQTGKPYKTRVRFPVRKCVRRNNTSAVSFHSRRSRRY